MTEHHEKSSAAENEATGRDPHVEWWLAFQKQSFDVNNYELLTGREPTDDNDDYTGKMEVLSDLMDKILLTPPRTFAAARIQMKLVMQEFGEPSTDEAGGQALRQLRGFLSDVERVLKRTGRLAEVERSMQEHDAPPAAA